MEFQDRILRCVDCGTEFVWTAGEQQFFADKNFKNEPKRCKSCKGKRASRPAGAMSVRERVETVTNCSACGRETTVPFKPTQGTSGVLQGVLSVAKVRRRRRSVGFLRFHLFSARTVQRSPSEVLALHRRRALCAAGT